MHHSSCVLAFPQTPILFHQSNLLQTRKESAHGLAKSNTILGVPEHALPASLFQLPCLRHIYVHGVVEVFFLVFGSPPSVVSLFLPSIHTTGNRLSMKIVVGSKHIQLLRETADTAAGLAPGMLNSKALAQANFNPGCTS